MGWSHLGWKLWSILYLADLVVLVPELCTSIISFVLEGENSLTSKHLCDLLDRFLDETAVRNKQWKTMKNYKSILGNNLKNDIIID